ncbi:TonB-dependent receptor [bacterium]|nr:TonB-dependent receptor [bacterium]
MVKGIGRAFALGVLGMGAVQAAYADQLQGVVTDRSGQSPMQGAIVTIEELDRTATTGRFGEYRFSNIPAGTYTLRVSYVGADPVSLTVVVAGDDSRGDAQIGADVGGANILIVGAAAAQAGAINQQRASNAIISVIDSDALGNFPDTTVADSISRVPGVSIENDQGEGRYVSIRGLNTDLIASSINGVRTPSPEDRRGVLLDGVPADLLDSIEVQKSLTPDVDADTLGGVINLKTISAFDRKGRFMRAKLEGAYNEITEELSPKGTFTFSDTFGERLGVAFSVNYQDLRIEAHNNETGGWGEVDGADFLIPAPGASFIVPNDDYEQRFYDLTRERLGVVLNLDFQASDTTELYLRTLYNRYADDEIRNKFEFREFDEEIVSATQNTIAYRRGEVDAEVRLREEVRNIQTYSAGGITEFGDWTFNYEVSYAFAQEDDSNNHDVTFRSTPEQRNNTTGSIIFDYADPERPRISGPALPFLSNPANYELDAFEQEFTNNEDTEWAGKIDVARDALIGSTPVTWKGGLKFRDREKIRDQNILIWEDDSLILSDFVQTSNPIGNWRLPNPMYNWPDAGLTRALRGTFTPDQLDEAGSDLESIAGDYTIEEQILAGYAMGTFDIGALAVVAGVRVEQTDVSSVGNIFAEGGDPAAVTQRRFSRDYTDVLPSVNLKYSFSDKLVGRAAYYAAVVRPAFGEMAPTVAFNEDQDEIELGNPALEAYNADNFDLSLEYYPTRLSVVSGGVFHKEIDNAIFPATYDIGDLPASVDLSFLPAATVAGLAEVSTFINAGSARVTGLEFNYVQQLDFIGPVFEGFLASANLTLADSEATLPTGREVPLLKQNDTVWNFALGYDKGPWDIRVSANYRGDYLDEIFTTDRNDPDLDRYTDDRLLVEASIKYDLTPNVQLTLEGKNLTDAPEYYYHGDERRLSQYDEFGSTVVFGVRWTN